MYHNNYLSIYICFPTIFTSSKKYTTTINKTTINNERELNEKFVINNVGLENEDMTPTLKQIWVAVRQLQQDMNQIKIQVNEERALRSYLQQLLMGHLEGLSSTKNC